MDTSTTTPTQTSMFFALPRELRDEIYSLVHYQDNEHNELKPWIERNPYCFNLYSLKHIIEEQEERKEYRKKAWYNPLDDLPPRKSPLPRMAVCKQWYEEALEAWFRMITIRTSNLEDLVEECRRCPGAFWKTQLRHLEIDFETYWGHAGSLEYYRSYFIKHEVSAADTNPMVHALEILLPFFANLRTLSIKTSDEIFLEFWPWLWRTVDGHISRLPSESEFAFIPGIQAFMRAIKDVEKFIIVPTKDWSPLDGEMPWREHIGKLEKWIGEQVLIMRQESDLKKRKRGIEDECNDGDEAP